MQIQKNATQEELEALAHAYARRMYRDVLQLHLAEQLVIIFLCLLIPPSIFGFFMSGAVLTALFVCFCAWAYINNEVQLLHNALMWWYIWAGLVYAINLLIRACICRKLSKHLAYYKDADDTDATPTPHLHQRPLTWEKDKEQQHWQSIILFEAPIKGIYAFEWVIENYNGSIEHAPEYACASHMEQIPGERIRYTALHRLEPGKHWLAISLSNAEGEQGPQATVSQLTTLSIQKPATDNPKS